MNNTLYEQLGNGLRDGIASIGARFDPNKVATQLVERGASIGVKALKKKTGVALAVGIGIGVGVTLIAMGIVNSAKRKKKKLQKTVKLLRREPDQIEAPEAAKETEDAE